VKILFISFADGSKDYLEANNRILRQASESSWFDTSIVFNHAELLKISKKYLSMQYQLPQLINYPRYFLASKAFLVESAMAGTLGKYDCVLYADAGCEILANKISEKTFQKMSEVAMDTGGYAQQLEAKEWQYSKKEFLDGVGATNKERESGQIQATFQIWRQDQLGLDVSRNWVDWTDPSLNYWQNPTSSDIQPPGFVQHRRDQSLLSILWKRSRFSTEPVSRSYSGYTDLFRSSNSPIHTLRNRTGKEIIPNAYRNNHLIKMRHLGNLLKTTY